MAQIILQFSLCVCLSLSSQTLPLSLFLFLVLFLSVSLSPTILLIGIILKQAFSTKGLKQSQCLLLLQLLFQVERDLFQKC